MSKSKYNYKVYNGKALREFVENSNSYMLLLLFVAGLIIGTLSGNNESEISKKIAEITDSFVALKSNGGFIEILINSMLSNGILMILNLFLAFSLIGYPLLIWIPCLKGIGLGAIAGYLYSVYRLTGLGYCILTVFPGAIVSTVALIIACNDGCGYSKNAFMKALRGRGQYEKDETKIFLIRQVIMIGICIVSSVIDSLFSVVFSGFFKI